MKVHTNLSKLDLLRYNILVFPRIAVTYKSIAILSLLLLLFLCWSNGIPDSSRGWLVLVFSSVFGGMFGVLFGFVYCLVMILLTSKKKDGVLGEHEYSISEDGLYEKTLANEGTSNWNGVQKINVYGNYLLFQIPGNMFHILKRSDFDNTEHFEKFIALSKSYWGKAHNK